MGVYKELSIQAQEGNVEAKRILENISKGKTQPLDLSDVEVDDIDYGSGAPKFIDAYVTSASWKSTGEELTDHEINRLNEESLFVNETANDRFY